MRWVDRGPEPDGVAEYARQFTQGWVDYIDSKNHRGQPGLPEPADHRWGDFRNTLGNSTNNICWYCERQCDEYAEYGGRAPTVDHFRPRSRFPQLAYEWSNWIFSCYACNAENKGDRWPDSGYVDPCADVVTERPEQYFDYDADTGQIVPKDDLPGTTSRKASNTIRDLGLNRLDVMLYRQRWTLKFIYDVLELPASSRQAFIEHMTGAVPYAGTTRVVVEQLRQAGRI